MTDDTNAAAAAAVPNSLRADLEEAWDRLSAEADGTDLEIDADPNVAGTQTGFP